MGNDTFFITSTTTSTLQQKHLNQNTRQVHTNNDSHLLLHTSSQSITNFNPTMFFTSIPYKNLIFHTLLSLSITLFLTLLNIPIRFIEGLHTYIHPENIGNGKSQSGVRAAIRRPESNESSSEPKKKNRSKFEFDENNAQIFRLQLVDDHIRSRLYFTDYQNIFVYSFVAISNLILHHFLPASPEGSGILATGSVIPTVLGFVTVSKAVVVIAKTSFERSASKRSDKQMSVILGLLGFVLAASIVFEVSSKVFDFKFDSIDGLGKVSFSLLAGCIAGFLYMPAIKSARCFWLGTDQLRWSLSIISAGWFARLLLYVNYLVFVTASLLWINPVVEIFIHKSSSSSYKANSSNNLAGSFGMKRSDFINLRMWCLLGSGLVQIVALRPNLQMFLNEAVLSWYQRLHASKMPDLDFSRAKIFLHNYYLCLVVLQFFVPPALILIFLGLSRTEGNFIDTFPFVCSFVPCSAFVKEVALFMSWWVVFVLSIFTSSTLVFYRCGILYVS